MFNVDCENWFERFTTYFEEWKKDLIKENDKYKQLLEEIRNIADKLITGLPEYHSCYYKDECGDNCTPKKQSKVEYCCHENVDKILTIINEVLNV